MTVDSTNHELILHSRI